MVYPISESSGKLVGFTLDDIDLDNVNLLEYNYDAKRHVAKLSLRFRVSRLKNVGYDAEPTHEARAESRLV